MSFNVVIDSEDAYNTTSIYDKEYGIDWGFIPQGKYELTFSFKSSPIPDEVADVETIALIGLGTQLKTYTAGSGTNTQNSGIIGHLDRSVVMDTTARQVFTQGNYNPPVSLDTRPSNNIFRVRIQTGNNEVATTGLTSANYILILRFNKVE